MATQSGIEVAAGIAETIINKAITPGEGGESEAVRAVDLITRDDADAMKHAAGVLIGLTAIRNDADEGTAQRRMASASEMLLMVCEAWDNAQEDTE